MNVLFHVSSSLPRCLFHSSADLSRVSIWTSHLFPASVVYNLDSTPSWVLSGHSFHQFHIKRAREGSQVSLSSSLLPPLLLLHSPLLPKGYRYAVNHYKHFVWNPTSCVLESVQSISPWVLKFQYMKGDLFHSSAIEIWEVQCHWIEIIVFNAGRKKLV